MSMAPNDTDLIVIAEARRIIAEAIAGTLSMDKSKTVLTVLLGILFDAGFSIADIDEMLFNGVDYTW